MVPPGLVPQMYADVMIYIKENTLITTVDRVRNCIHSHRPRMGGWKSPLLLLVSTAGTLVTSEFHDAFGIPRSVWQGVYVLVAAGSIVWLVVSLFRSRRFNEEDFVRDLRMVPLP